jgi:hypothetical protein
MTLISFCVLVLSVIGLLWIALLLYCWVTSSWKISGVMDFIFIIPFLVGMMSLLWRLNNEQGY